MIATLLSYMVLGQNPEVDSKDLPNGAKYRVEREAGTGQVMVTLYVDEANLPEDGGTPGTRHLLEHLIAKGSDRMLDVKLESIGLTMTAYTERDGTAFVIMGPSEHAVMAIESLRELLAPLEVGEEELKNELKIIDQEGIFRDRFARFMDSAWLALFDPGVGTIHGNLNAMAQLAPADLRGYSSALMSGGGLTVFVKGDVDPGVTGLRLTEILGEASTSETNYIPRNFLESIGRKESVKAKGAARAVVLAGLDRPMTLARIGVGLALQKLEPGFELVYEPSFDRGVLLLFSQDASSFESLSKYSYDDIRRIAPYARLQATRYANGLLTEGPGYGVLRAKQMRQAPSFDLRQIRSTAAGLTDEEVWGALQDWQGGAMHIEGTE